MNKKQFIITTSLIVLAVLAGFASIFLRLNRNSIINTPITTQTATTTNRISSTTTSNATISLPQRQTAPSYEYDVNLPNALILVDSQGRRTGKDPITGVFYHEIPGTGYGEAEHSGQLGISGPVGRYTLYILGSSTGSYWIDAWPRQEVRGNIQAGAMDAYKLDFGSTSAENPKLVFQGTLSSTASITTEPPHNLPLP